MYRQPVLIYNPTAGKVRKDPQRILQRTIAALARVNLSPKLAATQEAAHATKLARDAVRHGADLVLVLGGDGTINEAANGMLHSGVPLGVIPAGTANVLAMELGLGSRIEPAVQKLAASQARSVAVGRASAPNGASRYFLCMSGSGLDAKIVYDVNPGLKLRTGKLAYWTAGLSQLAHRLEQVHIRMNGQEQIGGFVLASRVRNYGGDLEIASGASLLSDEFEVVVFEGSNPLRYIWYMLGVGLKRVQKMRGVRTFRTRRLDILDSTHLQVDGEYAGSQPASIEIVPQAVKLLIPPSYA